MAEGLLRLHFNPQGEVREAARECEFDVFSKRFGNTREQLVEEYARYDAASAFVAVSEESGRVVAASRLIVSDAAGLKTLVDMAEAPWHAPAERCAAAAGLQAGSTWDVATLVSRSLPAPQKLMAVAAMWYGLMASGQMNGVTHIMAILDERVRGLMASMGLLMHAFPGTSTMPYLGSPGSTPVYTGFPEMLTGQRRMNPDAYRLVTLGVGLDGVSIPERDAFRLRQHAPVVDVRDLGHDSAAPSVQHGQVGDRGRPQD